MQQRIAWADEAVRIAEGVGDGELEYWVSLRRDATALECGDRVTAEHYRVRQLSLTEQLNLPVMRWLTTCAEGARSFVDGDLVRAEATASEALELGLASGQPDALSYYGAQLLTIRAMQGRLGELESLIRQQADANPGIPSFRVALAGLCADDSRCDEALELLSDDVATGFTRFPKDPMWFVNLTGAARALVGVSNKGHQQEAQRMAEPLFRILEPWVDRGVHIHVLTRPPVAYALGILATMLNREEVDEYFAAALDFARRLQAPLFIAMTQIEWAASRLQRHSGDRIDDRTLVETALATAMDAAACAIEARAREVLEQHF